jgi:hypothetical protein
MKPAPHFRLSVVLVVGRQRARAQTVLDGIGAQQCAGLETILIDLSPALPPLRVPAGLTVQKVQDPALRRLGAARIRAVHIARAPYIAYLEDHCTPQAGWAEALLQAFAAGPWAAVGYAFVNANPATWVSRSCMTADYGLWAAPHPDVEKQLLPGNNVAYRREILLGYGERLGSLLSPDFVMHERLRLDGHRLFLAGSAVAAHENPTNLRFLLQANHAYCRILAHQRASSRSWGLGRRWFYALSVLLGAPAIKLFRTLRACSGSPARLGRFATALPAILPTYLWSAVGEAIGYACGPGRAEAEFDEYELNHARI